MDSDWLIPFEIVLLVVRGYFRTSLRAYRWLGWLYPSGVGDDPWLALRSIDMERLHDR